MHSMTTGRMVVAALALLASAAGAQEPVAAELAARAAALDAARVRMGMAGVRQSTAQERLVAAEMRMELARVRAMGRVGVRERAPDVPEPWIQEDPGSRDYQRAREALNLRQYRSAASAFETLRSNYPTSGYVPDSYYWQAFALSRAGNQADLRRALELLQTQRASHPNAATRADADELRVRVEAQLARRGDETAAAQIAQQAAGPCDENQGVRLAALSALLNMNAERAVPILKEVLQSRGECSVELRRRAVYLLAQKMTDETVDILLDLAHRNPDPDKEVREQAVFWLHQVRTPEALDALEAILTESDDPDLQERAIFSISQRRGDERAVQILHSYAERSDVSRELRENAIFWIGQNPRAGGVQYLIDLYARLDDQDLKERAIFGVGQSRNADGARWLRDLAMNTSEPTELRKQALFWLGQSGGLESVDLRQLFTTLDDPEMKEQVVFVASQSNDSASVDFLMDVARNETDRDLRERAIFWLGQSKDPRVAEFLLSLIRG